MLKTIMSKLGLLAVVVIIVTFLTALLMAQLPAPPENILVPVATEEPMKPLEHRLITDEVSNPAECTRITTAELETGKITATIDGATKPLIPMPAGAALKSQDMVDVNSFCTVATARVKVRSDLNLNDPVPVRWAKWFGNFLQGDMGNWYKGVNSTSPVGKDVKARIGNSFLLLLYTQIIALGVAIPMGVWAAYRQGTWIDKIISSGGFAALALPSFAVGLVLAYYLGVKLHIVPPSGFAPLLDDPWRHFQTMLIPSIALALGQIAVYMRLLRSDMVATLQQDFVTMARAKGLSPRRVLFRHALRPSSLTLLTVAGLNVGTLIGGSVVVEYLFGVPGLGSLIGLAIFGRQVAALQSLVALLAIIFVVVNILVDILYTVLDPRIRHAR